MNLAIPGFIPQPQMSFSIKKLTKEEADKMKQEVTNVEDIDNEHQQPGGTT